MKTAANPRTPSPISGRMKNRSSYFTATKWSHSVARLTIFVVVSPRPAHCAHLTMSYDSQANSFSAHGPLAAPVDDRGKGRDRDPAALGGGAKGGASDRWRHGWADLFQCWVWFIICCCWPFFPLSCAVEMAPLDDPHARRSWSTWNHQTAFNWSGQKGDNPIQQFIGKLITFLLKNWIKVDQFRIWRWCKNLNNSVHFAWI